MRTRFTELVGCTHPVQLAAMGGGVGGPQLATAVRDAGGLGMVSFGEVVPEQCGINFLVPFVASPDLVGDLGRGAHVVEFFFGAPDEALVTAAHETATIVGWQVGSVPEATAAAAIGCDYVVAQGVEAGGHVRATAPLDEVLADVLAAVDVPVVAAGGIATAQRVRDVIDRGADAVRVGTRFLACPEAHAHADYVANLLAAGDDDTALTEWFDEGWPDAPHRVLRAALETAQRTGWRSALPPTPGATRRVDDMAQYAGAGVGAVRVVQPAAKVVRDLVAQLDA